MPHRARGTLRLSLPLHQLSARRRDDGPGSALGYAGWRRCSSMTFERAEPKQDANAVEESSTRDSLTLLQPLACSRAERVGTWRPGAIRAIVALGVSESRFVRSTNICASLSRALTEAPSFALGFRYLAVIYSWLPVRHQHSTRWWTDARSAPNWQACG